MGGLVFLAGLESEDRKALASHAHRHALRAGDALFRRGEPGDRMHVVVDGRIRVFVDDAIAGQATLALLGPGDCVGELSLLTGRPRSATAVASTAATTLAVTRDAFIAWLQEHPAASLTLLETVSMRLRRTADAMTDIIFPDQAQRLAKLLETLAEIESRAHPVPDGEVRIAISQAELAEILGIGRETVNKHLRALELEGCIARGRKAVTIVDRGGLRRMWLAGPVTGS